MHLIRYPDRKDWPDLLKRPQIDRKTINDSVRQILDDVRVFGNAAVKKYTELYDGERKLSFEILPEHWKTAADQITPELKKAIDVAIRNIRLFHSTQADPNTIIEIMPGVKCWRRSVGIEKVGLYVPGGTAPLFSTLLMLAIPAKLARCKQIIVCTPADENELVHPAILYAAMATGIDRLFAIGGAQAIAAMAYGTETVPRVNKIFGPGNQYVTCAKMLLQTEGIAIDMPAGPSEVAVLADNSCIPAFVAADLISQAEHGEDSQVLLVSDSERNIYEILDEVQKQLMTLPRSFTATQSLSTSKAILVKNLNEGMELINQYAPEHLIIACKNDEQLANQVVNAGSVFLGNYSPESAGDYATGTNHTLPTNGHARAYSGVSLDSFTKKITFQKLTEQGLYALSDTITVMANAEWLEGHANAVSIRTKNKINELVRSEEINKA